ncbi:hypothetical protein U9M48_020420 [Paspalum notatum var. saurae]|uniref:Uncharacterized protein n=1 Tax=Paspalum notatum var. saurae TaxID=547442 RepID=A0AAQ3THH1_PASNO
MEFPHHHGHRRDDDDDERRAPPPTAHGGYGYGQAPPPDPYGRAPAPHQPAYGGDAAYGRHQPDPAYGGAGGGYGNVVHVSHEAGDGRPHHGVGGAYGGGGGSEYGHEARPHHGGGGYGVGGAEYGHDARPHHGVGGAEYGHESRPHHGGAGGGAAPVRQETFRIYCKAGEDQYSLACRGGKVCLVRTDRNDDAQVRLTRYDPNATLDESILWTESRDVGDGYRCIRMVNNIYLNFDALNGDKDHGGVRDGTTLVLWEWCEGDNQRWKIASWNKKMCGAELLQAGVLWFLE